MAVWAQTAVNGNINTGTAMSRCSVNVPAKATIQRVVQNVMVAGVASSVQSVGYISIQGMYFKNQIIVARSGWPDHQLHYSSDRVPVSYAAMFDSTQVPPIGQNRLLYGLYSGGDRELGQNIKTSYGGPVMNAALTVQMLSGLFLAQTGGQQDFPMWHSVVLRVLYYVLV